MSVKSTNTVLSAIGVVRVLDGAETHERFMEACDGSFCHAVGASSRIAQLITDYVAFRKGKRQWHVVELSNNAIYLAPGLSDEPVIWVNPKDQEDYTTMSADAVGLLVTLLVTHEMHRSTDRRRDAVKLWHDALWLFVQSHPEGEKIDQALANYW